jgi:hypothetical protein
MPEGMRFVSSGSEVGEDIGMEEETGGMEREEEAVASDGEEREGVLNVWGTGGRVYVGVWESEGMVYDWAIVKVSRAPGG